MQKSEDDNSSLMTGDQESAVADLALRPSSRRHVQPKLAIITIFGSCLLQGTLIYLGIILSFMRIWGHGANPYPLVVHIWHHSASAYGLVEAVRDDGTSVNQQSYLKYTYHWTDANAKEHLSECYALEGSFKPGDYVMVDYIAANPTVNQIHSAFYTPLNYIAGLFLFLIFIGILLAQWGLRNALGNLRLLMHGDTAIATLADKSRKVSTDSDGDKVVDFDLTYVFRTRDGREYNFFKYATAFSDGFDQEPDTASDDEETQEAEAAPEDDRGSDDDPKLPEEPDLAEAPVKAYVLYLPENPNIVIMARDLPGHPRFNQPGRVYSGRPVALLGWLFIPVLVIVGQTLWWYLAR
jgi:hypothetical protein